MAEGRTNNTSSSCWFFANYGSCRQGTSCPYPHVAPTAPLACRYFQQGRCIFGRSCRNLHSGVSRASESSDESDGQAVMLPTRQANSRGAGSPGQHGKAGVRPAPSPSTSSRASGETATATSPSWASSAATAAGSTGGRRKARGSLARLQPPITQASGLKGPSSLGKQIPATATSSSDRDCATSSLVLPRPPSEWVHAPEFVPTCGCADNKSTAAAEARGLKSYAQVVKPRGSGNGSGWSTGQCERPLCPYAAAGECLYAAECTYLHGQICELCNKACLHPFDEEQRKKHKSECVKQHEKDMELSFAIARSKEKMCGICFEVIMEKTPREQRFGILPNCNHCFCLGCIRTWRQAKQFENNITRACPECRVTSDFVCPSMYWVDTKEDKGKLITDYKGALSTKDCKYFKKGEGKCPFGNKCFYLHVLPDGSRIDVGPPSRQRRHNADGEMDVLQHIILWDFLEERDAHILYLDELDLDDSFFTDSDFSDSDIDFMF